MVNAGMPLRVMSTSRSTLKASTPNRANPATRKIMELLAVFLAASGDRPLHPVALPRPDKVRERGRSGRNAYSTSRPMRESLMLLRPFEDQ